jgi:tetratricopeptide (TPR) repeat protein
MIDHPPRFWMTGFIRGKLSPRRRRAYVVHMLSGCVPCREEIAPIARVMFRPGCATEPGQGGAEYDGPIDRAVLFAIKRGRERMRERAEAEANFPQLLKEGWKSVHDSREFWTWGLCELLLERSWSFRHENAREMLRLAGLACEAADRLDPQLYGQVAIIDMRARAWGEYANACRVTGDLVQAEWSLHRALELRKQGSGAPILRARLAELTAGILCYQRQFQPALRAFDLAYSLYVRQGHMEDALRVLIGSGIYTGRSGDPELALLILARALVFAAEHKVSDSKLTFITLHNILLFRVERGEFDTANRQLFEMRPLYARYAGAIDSLKLRWIEARIAAGLGDDERAEKIFLEVREDFNKRGQVYHSAIVGLELSAIWLRQGRLSDVKRTVGEMLEVFRSRHVARESIAALLMLREALERDRATAELILGVAGLIELHQGDSHDNTNSAHP